MITEDKVIEIFCMADDFCKFFDAMMAKYTIRLVHKRKYHRSSTMSKAEVMLIMILFHDSGYRCLKNFYLEKVCIHLRNLFPERSEEHTSELQYANISYAVFCLKKKKNSSTFT